MKTLKLFTADGRALTNLASEDDSILLPNEITVYECEVIAHHADSGDMAFDTLDDLCAEYGLDVAAVVVTLGRQPMHNKLVAPHKVDRSTEHYAAVKAEMAKRGECVIRALWSDELGYWFAIEGSHRCAAAEELGIEIQIHDIGSDDEDEWVTDLDGWDVARDWEWLTDYLVSVANVNDSAIYEAVA